MFSQLGFSIKRLFKYNSTSGLFLINFGRALDIPNLEYPIKIIFNNIIHIFKI